MLSWIKPKLHVGEDGRWHAIPVRRVVHLYSFWVFIVMLVVLLAGFGLALGIQPQTPPGSSSTSPVAVVSMALVIALIGAPIVGLVISIVRSISRRKYAKQRGPVDPIRATPTTVRVPLAEFKGKDHVDLQGDPDANRTAMVEAVVLNWSDETLGTDREDARALMSASSVDEVGAARAYAAYLRLVGCRFDDASPLRLSHIDLLERVFHIDAPRLWFINDCQAFLPWRTVPQQRVRSMFARGGKLLRESESTIWISLYLAFVTGAKHFYPSLSHLTSPTSAPFLWHSASLLAAFCVLVLVLKLLRSLWWARVVDGQVEAWPLLSRSRRSVSLEPDVAVAIVYPKPQGRWRRWRSRADMIIGPPVWRFLIPERPWIVTITEFDPRGTSLWTYVQALDNRPAPDGQPAGFEQPEQPSKRPSKPAAQPVNIRGSRARTRRGTIGLSEPERLS